MKRSSNKVFSGSKDKSFYNESYFLNGIGSMYGKLNDKGEYVFFPYTEQYQLPYNKKFANSFSSLSPDSILILGCARGYLVRAFIEENIKTIGIDLSEWAIENCDPHIKDFVYQGDVCDLSMFKNKEFDVVIALDIFEHIKVPDLFIAIDEATRVGKLVMIGLPIAEDDSRPDRTDENEGSHVSVYSINWWINEFYKRGFVVVDCKFMNEGHNTNIIFADVMNTKKYRVFRKNGIYKISYEAVIKK